MYKGDVTPAEAFEVLSHDDHAVLVDVRTEPEWAYVGIPAIERLVRLSWQVYPTMSINQGFVEQFQELGLASDTPIYLLCRSGVRSAAAAQALTAAGYENAYNIIGGFEGDRDGEGHRGSLNGWRKAGLPWVQG